MNKDSVYYKWYAWQKKTGVQGDKYRLLYARLVRSPNARRIWAGLPY